jgi:hypothetical protein
MPPLDGESGQHQQDCDENTYDNDERKVYEDCQEHSHDETDGDSAPNRLLDRHIEFSKQFHDSAFAPLELSARPLLLLLMRRVT